MNAGKRRSPGVLGGAGVGRVGPGVAVDVGGGVVGGVAVFDRGGARVEFQIERRFVSEPGRGELVVAAVFFGAAAVPDVVFGFGAAGQALVDFGRFVPEQQRGGDVAVELDVGEGGAGVGHDRLGGGVVADVDVFVVLGVAFVVVGQEDREVPFDRLFQVVVLDRDVLRGAGLAVGERLQE